jgi:hypothetical protein
VQHGGGEAWRLPRWTRHVVSWPISMAFTSPRSMTMIIQFFTFLWTSIYGNIYEASPLLPALVMDHRWPVALESSICNAISGFPFLLLSMRCFMVVHRMNCVLRTNFAIYPRLLCKFVFSYVKGLSDNNLAHRPFQSSIMATSHKFVRSIH